MLYAPKEKGKIQSQYQEQTEADACAFLEMHRQRQRKCHQSMKVHNSRGCVGASRKTLCCSHASKKCCENRLRSGIISSRGVSIVVDCDYDYGNDRV